MLGFAPLGAAPLGAPSLQFAEASTDVIVGALFLGDCEAEVREAPQGQQLQSAVRFVDTMEALRGLGQDAADGLILGDRVDQLGAVRMVQRMVLGDAVQPRQIFRVLLRDQFRLTEDFRSIFPFDIVEMVQVTDRQAVRQAFRLAERLRVQDTMAARASYGVAVLQTLRLRASLAQFFSADVDELWGIVDETVAQLRAMVGVGEQVRVEALVEPRLLLSVKVRDTVAIEARDVLRMIFNPSITEGVEITAGYVAPDGSFTTWAMNTRTAAVTEYSDFAFNSFARLGNRYLGASADGLFELVGDTDAGGDIIARIRSGYMQFGGPRLSRLKEAYIAARGEGEVLLRIITADGETYTYAASTRNMRSTKVHMGKGQRSRYFAFELVTAGQDFDLDTIEFVPIVMQRRV